MKPILKKSLFNWGSRPLYFITIVIMATVFFPARLISITASPDCYEQPGNMFPHLADVLMIANPDIDGIIDAPTHVWNNAAESGAIALRFRPSRELRVRSDQPLTIPLIVSPLIDIAVVETENHSQITIRIPTSDDQSKPVTDEMMISHLKPQWYHIIVTWDAKAGKIEWYLNGILQMNGRDFTPPWKALNNADGVIRAGGWFGHGRHKTGIEAADISIRRGLTDKKTARLLAEEAGLTRLDGEGRTIYDSALDLSGLTLNLIYESDFSQPLNMIHEDDLFEGTERVREPGPEVDWVLEGNGHAQTTNGRLKLINHDAHVVLWNTRTFPENFLLEFTMDPEDPNQRLAIVFFCARPVAGEHIFSPGLPRRNGNFHAYTRNGFINSYHISYMANYAADEQGRTVPRRTTNLRKNDGFFMVASGDERIYRDGEGINTIRVLKHENRIRMEVNGKISIAFDDDEQRYGLPVWGEGKIGLRQMDQMGYAEYESFRVYRIENE